MRKPAIEIAASPAPVENDRPTTLRVAPPSLVTLSAPLSPEAEAIRAIRTHLVSQHVEKGRRGLAICAASLDVGCTFVAANLAVAFAQVGLNTLLIDGDLREPSVQKFVPPPAGARGLAEALSVTVPRAGDFINKAVLPNLSVLYAGEANINSRELLARDQFEVLMEECLREHEITIVDTPPANSSADTRRICNVAGYALVVGRRNKSVVSDVRTLITQLSDDHATVVGTVYNAL